MKLRIIKEKFQRKSCLGYVIFKLALLITMIQHKPSKNLIRKMMKRRNKSKRWKIMIRQKCTILKVL